MTWTYEERDEVMREIMSHTVPEITRLGRRRGICFGYTTTKVGKANTVASSLEREYDHDIAMSIVQTPSSYEWGE